MIQRHIFRRERPLKRVWPKLNMPWDISPRLVLGLRPTSRMQNDGIGDQHVSFDDDEPRVG